MLRVFADAGFQVPARVRRRGGAPDVPDRADRGHRSRCRAAGSSAAEARSIARLLRPGRGRGLRRAARRYRHRGGLLRHLRDAGFTGAARSGPPDRVHSGRCCRRVAVGWSTPAPGVDLAVVAVPPAAVDRRWWPMPRAAGVARAGGRLGRLRRGRRRPARRPRPRCVRRGAGGRAAAWSARTASAWRTPTRRSVSMRHSRPALPPPGRVGFFCQSAALGIGAAGRGRPARPRPVQLRLGRQPGRRVRQRPAAVLARRPAHRCGAAVPGDLRQPAQVRPDRPAARPGQAGGRGGHAGRRPVRGEPAPPRPGRPVAARPRCSPSPA